MRACKQRQKLEELIKRTKPLVVAINVKDVGMDARYMKNRVGACIATTPLTATRF